MRFVVPDATGFQRLCDVNEASKCVNDHLRVSPGARASFAVMAKVEQ